MVPLESWDIESVFPRVDLLMMVLVSATWRWQCGNFAMWRRDDSYCFLAVCLAIQVENYHTTL
jgi:hypothetical protein